MPNTLFSVSSMILQSKLSLHNKTLTRTTERLATGSRINNAKDSPFGNYEAENAASELGTSGKAKQNSSEGFAFLQIAEGTCGEVQNILQRIRELSIQSANDTLSSSERNFLNIEANGLLKEIDRITAGTTYNKKQVFGNQGDSFSDESRDLKNWNPFIRERDANGNEVRAGILHIGPSASPGKYHDVNEVKVSIPELSAKHLGLDTLSLTYQNGASKAIDDLDAAIGSIGTVRSYMGSLVNRMDMQIEHLEERSITVNDHISKIKDADYARESTTLLTAQIQQQAAASILAQSNSSVNRVLEMLGPR